MPAAGGPSDFAPDDPTDGREKLEWETKYPDGAQRKFRIEAVYLASLLLLIPLFLLVVWMRVPQQRMGLDDAHYQVFARYAIAWASGTLGGVLFDVKWLYHCVARQIWNEDRQLWRLFTPHISGGLAFVMIALISSGIITILNQRAVQSGAAVVGVSFMVGYFSDSAIAKLTELADTLFGSVKRKPSDGNGKRAAGKPEDTGESPAR